MTSSARTRSEVIARWQARRDEMDRFRSLVDGVSLCDEVLADLTLLAEAEGAELLTLTEAARVSGYSREYLGRLQKTGKLPNMGRPRAPRIQRSDLPLKPGYLPDEPAPEHLTTSSKRQIVRSVVAQGKGTR